MSSARDRQRSLRELRKLLEDYEEQGAMAAFRAEPHEGWFLDPIESIRRGHRWGHGIGEGDYSLINTTWAEQFWDVMETIAWHYEMHRMTTGDYILEKPFHKLGPDIFFDKDPRTGRTLMENFSGWDSNNNTFALSPSGPQKLIVEFTSAKGKKVYKDVRINDHVICNKSDCPARGRSACFCRRIHDCATPNKFQKLIPCDDSMFGEDDALSSINLIQKRTDNFEHAEMGIGSVNLTFSDEDIIGEIKKKLISLRVKWAREPREEECVRPNPPRKQRPRSWKILGLMFLVNHLRKYHMSLKKKDMEAISHGRKQFLTLNQHYYRGF